MKNPQSLSNRLSNLERRNSGDSLKSIVIVNTLVSPARDNIPDWEHMASGPGWSVIREDTEPLDEFRARAISTAKDAGCTISFDN